MGNLERNKKGESMWLDRYTSKLGFGWLSNQLPGEVPPSYLYGIMLILLIDPVANAWAYFGGYRSIYFDNPYFILQPIGLVASIYVSRSLLQTYDEVMDWMNVEDRADEPDSLTQIVPDWLPWLILLAGAGFFYSNAFIIGLNNIYRTDGLVGIIAALIINPLVWGPIGAQFISVYLSIELLAPYRLMKSEVGIHFFDPERLGGLRPISELVKQTCYYMMLGLILYALIIYHPFFETQGTQTGVADVVFTGIWLVIIAIILFAILTLHYFMLKEKKEKLCELDRETRDLVENPCDIKQRAVPNDVAKRVEEIEDKMEVVSSTKEYPATFSTWLRLLLGVLSPKGLQLLLASV